MSFSTLRPKNWETVRFWNDVEGYVHPIDATMPDHSPIHGKIPGWVKERHNGGVATPKTERNTTQQKFNLTDAGNAYYFTEQYGDSLRYDHRRSHWLEWHTHYWKRENDGHIMRLALEATKTKYLSIANLDDLSLKEKTARWAINSEQRARLEACISIAKNLKPIADSGENWDKNGWLFCTINGVVDLSTGELRKGTQEDLITMHTRVVYDITAKAPRWIQFLDEIFNGDSKLVEWIQRYLGYCLTGDTREQTIAIPFGRGANGKTKLLSLLRHIWGDYAYDAPFSTFELNQRAAIPNDLAALVGKRLVTSSETNEGTRLNEGRIKGLTGQDSVTARFLHAEFFTFEPVAKFFLAVNHRPRVRDNSYGFWRRVRLIPFNREFKGAEEDKLLGDKLLEESSGILNWLIEGCLAWQKHGIEPTPDCVLKATEEYKTDSDPLSQFLLDECAFSPQAKVRGNSFYKEYLKWAEEQGLRERERMTNNAFGRIMGNRLQKYHDREGTYYQGVGLKCDGFVTDYETGGNSPMLMNILDSHVEKCGNMESHTTTTPNNPSQKAKAVTNPSQPFSPDCPSCGGRVIEYSKDMQTLVCSCGHRFPVGGEK